MQRGPSRIAALHNVVPRRVDGKDADELFPCSTRAGALLRQAQTEAQDHCPDVLDGPPQGFGYGFDFHPARNTAPKIVDVALRPALVIAGHGEVPASAPSAGIRVASSHLHRSPSPEDVGIPARPGSTFTEQGSAGA